MLELEQILAEGHVAVPLISTTLDIVKVVVVAARAPGQWDRLVSFSQNACSCNNFHTDSVIKFLLFLGWTFFEQYHLDLG